MSSHAPRRAALGLALLTLVGCSRRVVDAPREAAAATSPAAAESVHSFRALTIDKHDKALADYRGKVLLVVNVASKCGYTKQYAGLEALYRRYKDQGLAIAGFPANDFMGQEPGTEEEIARFCRLTYDVSFDLFAKIHVKGGEIHPLYAYLTERSPVPGPVSWNFNKFLVGRDGRVLARFDSSFAPDAAELTSRLEAALKAAPPGP